MARAFIGELLTWADIAPTTRTDAVHALAWPMPDYEDALQTAAAQACGASWIIPQSTRFRRLSRTGVDARRLFGPLSGLMITDVNSEDRLVQ